MSGGTQRSPEGGACGGAPETACGTSPRLRYSANRRAERPSAAQASSARKARPAGLGFCVPEAKCAGIPARTNASSSSGRYWNGDRSSTAIPSNGTPRSASLRTRRAISTHSRLSPGAERRMTSSPDAATGAFPSTNSRCCTRASEVSAASRSGRGATSRAREIRVASAAGAMARTGPRSRAMKRSSSAARSGRSTSSAGRSSSGDSASRASRKTAARSARAARPSSVSYASRTRPRSPPGRAPARRNSWIVLESARGRPGWVATGSNFPSRPRS